MDNLKPYILASIHSNLTRDILEKIPLNKTLKNILSEELVIYGTKFFQEIEKQLNKYENLSLLIMELYEENIDKKRLVTNCFKN